MGIKKNNTIKIGKAIRQSLDTVGQFDRRHEHLKRIPIRMVQAVKRWASPFKYTKDLL